MGNFSLPPTTFRNELENQEMFMTNVRKLLGAIPLLLFVLSSVHAQVTTSNVRGVVTDPNGQ